MAGAAEACEVVATLAARGNGGEEGRGGRGIVLASAVGRRAAKPRTELYLSIEQRRIQQPPDVLGFDLCQIELLQAKELEGRKKEKERKRRETNEQKKS